MRMGTKRTVSILLAAVLFCMNFTACGIPQLKKKDAAFLEAVKSAVTQSQEILEDVNKITMDMASESYGLEPGEDVSGYVKTCKRTLEDVEGYAGELRKLMQELERADDPITERGSAVYEAQQQYFEGALSTIEEMEKTLSFFAEQYEESLVLMDAIGSTADDKQQYLYQVYEAALDVKQSYLELETPDYLKDIWPLYVSSVDILVRYLQSQSWAESGDVLRYYSANQIIQRMGIVSNGYEAIIYELLQKEYIHCSDVMENNHKVFGEEIIASCDGGQLPQEGYMAAAPVTFFHESMIEEIYPNLYPAMDSIANLLIYTDKGIGRVTVSAEIPGFTQLYEQKVSISDKMTYVMIKPPILAEMPDLSAARDTQISFKVTDDFTGEVLMQESKPLKLYSIYDYKNYTDEFGIIQNDNILAWMTPESDGVLAVRRNAIGWLEYNLGASNGILPGYQPSYGYSAEEGANITYIEVAAIQSAISAMGVRYNMGPYSLNASQRVLMPDAVLSSQSGICIETAVLMASVLQSANMHAMIVFTPGHAQVAVETWSNSGQYFLIETTTLPFDATQNDISSVIIPLSNEEWESYLGQKAQQAQESGGMVYVVDCDLAKDLNIKGLSY